MLFHSTLSIFLFFFPLRVSLLKTWHTIGVLPFFSLFKSPGSVLFMFFHIKSIINNICTGTGIINLFIFIISRFLLLHFYISRRMQSRSKACTSFTLTQTQMQPLPWTATHNCFPPVGLLSCPETDLTWNITADK